MSDPSTGRAAVDDRRRSEDGRAAESSPPLVKGSVATRLFGGSAAGSLGFAVTVLQAVLQVPLLLQVWPAETFAVWMGVQGLFGLITSVDVGFHAFVGAEANMVGVERPAEVQRLLSSAVRVTVVSAVLQALGCVLVALVGRTGAGLGPWAAYLREVGPPLVALALYWLLIGSLNGLLCRLFLAHGETVRYQLFGVVQRALVFLAVIAEAWGGGGVTEVAVAYAFASGVVSAFTVLDLCRRRGPLMPRWMDGSWGQAWTTLRRSLGISLSMFLEQTTNGGVAAFASAALPAATASQFSTMRSLTNAVSQASGVVMFPTVPEFGRDATPARIHRASLLIDALMLVCVTPMAVATTAAAPWVPGLYAVWTRAVLGFDPSMFVALSAAVLIRQLGLPYLLFLIATNRVHGQFAATCLRAVVLVVTAAAIGRSAGAGGIAIGLAASELAVLAFASAATAADFRRYDGRIGRRHAVLAALHVLTTVTVLLAASEPRFSKGFPWAFGLAAHAAILGAQVRAVPPAFRERVRTWWAGTVRWTAGRWTDHATGPGNP